MIHAQILKTHLDRRIWYVMGYESGKCINVGCSYKLFLLVLASFSKYWVTPCLWIQNYHNITCACHCVIYGVTPLLYNYDYMHSPLYMYACMLASIGHFNIPTSLLTKSIFNFLEGICYQCNSKLQKLGSSNKKDVT